MARGATNVKENNQSGDKKVAATAVAKKPRKVSAVSLMNLHNIKNKYVPSDADKTIVKLATLLSLTTEEIARMLNGGKGIAKSTLYDHFRDELTNGKQQLLTKVAASLYGIATNPSHPQAASSCMFILKTKGQWRTADSINSVDVAVEKGAGAEAPIRFTLKIGERENADD